MKVNNTKFPMKILVIGLAMTLLIFGSRINQIIISGYLSEAQDKQIEKSVIPDRTPSKCLQQLAVQRLKETLSKD